MRGRAHRRDLNSEVFDGPYTHDMRADWQTGRRTWGFELADGRRATKFGQRNGCNAPLCDSGCVAAGPFENQRCRPARRRTTPYLDTNPSPVDSSSHNSAER
jgi:hypothetical protein